MGAIAAQTLFLGDTVTVDVAPSFRDPDGDPLTFAAIPSDPAVARAAAAGSQVSVISLARGILTVTVTARDPDGGEARQSFNVTIPNRAPTTIGEIQPQELFVGETVTVDVSAAFSDPDGDSLTFTAASSDTAVARASAAGSEVEVAAAAGSTATITVTARDPEGGEARQHFNVTIPNRAPTTAGEIEPQELFVGETVTVDVSAAFSDPDGDPLAFAAISSDSAVARAAVSGSQVSVIGLARGVVTVTVTARDPDGGEARQNFAVRVPNRPPVPVDEIESRELFLGETVTVDVSAAFRDPDGDPLTFAAASSDTAVARASAAGNEVEVAAAARSTATITVTARDPEGGEARQHFNVTIPNRAPTTVGEIEPQELFLGETVTVDVSAAFSDPDGDALVFRAASSDTAVALSSVSGSEVTVEARDRGGAAVTVTARDVGGDETSQSFQVTVPNREPVTLEQIPAQAVYLRETVTVDVSAAFRDPDGDPLEFEATSTDTSVAAVSTVDGEVSLTGVDRGTATVTVTARDPEDGEARQTFDVTVPNRDPVAAGALPPQTVLVDETFTMDVSPYFNDLDGDSLSYAPSISDARMADVLVSGSRVTVKGLDAGSALVTVTARDPHGGEARQSFGVTVESPVPPRPAKPSPANQAPVVTSAMPDLSARPGTQLSIAGSGYFSDPDGDELSYTGATSNPAVAAVRNVSSTVLSVTAVSPGEAEITVTATDPGGLVRSQSFTLTVGENPPPEVNTPPEVTGSPPDLVSAPGAVDTVGVSAYFRDPDVGDALTFSVSSSNTASAGATIHGDGVFGTSVVVTAVALGESTLTVTAQDLGGNQASVSFLVRVEANRPPRVTRRMDDRYIEVGHSITWNLSNHFSDPDGDALSYTVTGGGPPITLELMGDSLTITGVAPGMLEMGVTATDPGGRSVSQSFSFLVVASEVNPPPEVNTPPEVTGSPPDLVSAPGAVDTVGVSAYFRDPDVGDALTFSVSSSNTASAGATIHGDGVFGTSVVVTAVALGESTLTVTAQDLGGNQASVSFLVRVEANRPPRVTRRMENLYGEVGHSITWNLSNHFSDPDGDALSYTVTGGGPPITLELMGDSLTITGVAPGMLEMGVTATDPGGRSVSQSFSFLVVAS
ncbi:Ig-like domain-containing protein [Candidatus Palauibacter sp.]|uniref:Ig-like domain-containing protein n=1 Tax=Candidatus Palauibacter sp. TaxID=3101350 RepID=UPI003B01F8B6